MLPKIACSLGAWVLMCKMWLYDRETQLLLGFRQQQHLLYFQYSLLEDEFKLKEKHTDVPLPLTHPSNWGSSLYYADSKINTL